MVRLLIQYLCGLVIIGGVVAPAAAQQGATNGEWRSYGGDVGSTKYSSLSQITDTNFEGLEIAWRWRSVDTHVARAEGGRRTCTVRDQVRLFWSRHR